MISDNPFENLDDALFCDFGSEELLEEPLDATNLFEKEHMKHSALKIKPCVIKRHWRSMPIKRKKNLDEAQNVEASFSLLLLDEDEAFKLVFLLHTKMKKRLASMIQMILCRTPPPTWSIYTLMISYKLGDVDGM
jgi:hypothetical protein